LPSNKKRKNAVGFFKENGKTKPVTAKGNLKKITTVKNPSKFNGVSPRHSLAHVTTEITCKIDAKARKLEDAWLSLSDHSTPKAKEKRTRFLNLRTIADAVDEAKSFNELAQILKRHEDTLKTYGLYYSRLSKANIAKCQAPQQNKQAKS